MYSTIALVSLMACAAHCGDLGGHEILASHGGDLGGHGGDLEGHGGDLEGHGGNLGGHGGAYEEQYAPQPYKFGYRVNEEWGQQHREEQADGHGNVVGSYGFTDANGIYRQVNYVADKFGFRAQVKTNEPGTASSNPADTRIESSAPINVPHQGVGGYEEGQHGIKA
ncbi:cuticle protein 14 [Galendromus occidentalis]|uniref:Cuticle protein 14 n=1 Tax=Galendromus occidentalis TaxID=34638 RepID=A0AAJ6QY91_9ACAR|nr:cuticle protein 14 [Galendromus occidentalis]